MRKRTAAEGLLLRFDTEHLRQLLWRIYQHVRRDGLERVRRESVRQPDRVHAGIARGEHIDLGIADHDGLLGADAILFEQRARALRVGLLGVEAVAAVDLREEFAEA